MDIKNLFHDKRSVGRTVKASKTYHVWEFVLGGIIYKIELFNSVFSGKKKLVLNGSLVTDDEEYTSEFNYHFNLKSHSVKLYQKSTDKFELSIDERPFTLLMEDETSKTFSIVKKNDDTAVEELCGNNKKEVNIPSNYNKRHSSRPEIPNFFDDNDFDFGEGYVVTNNYSSSNTDNKSKNTPQESNLVGKPNTNDKFDLFGLDVNEKQISDNNINKNPSDQEGTELFSFSNNKNNTNNIINNDLFDFTSVKNDQSTNIVQNNNNINNNGNFNSNSNNMNQMQFNNYQTGINSNIGNNYPSIINQPYMNNVNLNMNMMNQNYQMMGNPQYNNMYNLYPNQVMYGMNTGVGRVPSNNLNDLSFLQYNRPQNQGGMRNSTNPMDYQMNMNPNGFK